MGDATEPRPGKIFLLVIAAMEPGLVHGNSGSIMSLRGVLSRRQDALLVRAPAGWEYPTTSEQRIAAIFRVSLIAQVPLDPA